MGVFFGKLTPHSIPKVVLSLHPQFYSLFLPVFLAQGDWFFSPRSRPPLVFKTSSQKRLLQNYFMPPPCVPPGFTVYSPSSNTVAPSKWLSSPLPGLVWGPDQEFLNGWWHTRGELCPTASIFFSLRISLPIDLRFKRYFLRAWWSSGGGVSGNNFFRGPHLSRCICQPMSSASQPMQAYRCRSVLLLSGVRISQSVLKN